MKCAVNGCQQDARDGYRVCVDHWVRIPLAWRKKISAELAQSIGETTPMLAYWTKAIRRIRMEDAGEHGIS